MCDVRDLQNSDAILTLLLLRLRGQDQEGGGGEEEDQEPAHAGAQLGRNCLGMQPPPASSPVPWQGGAKMCQKVSKVLFHSGKAFYKTMKHFYMSEYGNRYDYFLWWKYFWIFDCETLHQQMLYQRSVVNCDVIMK